ncbi:MAG TPA: SRPBCC family protein [Thermoplasmata archaeon]|nr:SRPBCC family protein [Thermoplasmata archaeon]
MAVKNLRQTVTVKAKPNDVYDALVDPRQHAQFTGAAAKISAKVGSAFSLYDNSLSGVVIVAERGRRLVLAWRSEDWPKGHYSIAQFTFARARGGTRLTFEQFGIPASDFADIREGWKQFYWEPLRLYLEG